MALYETPSGEWVEVDDNVSPEALARIDSQFKATPKTRKERVAAGEPRVQRPVSAHEQRVRDTMAESEKRNPYDATERWANSVLFGLMPRVAGIKAGVTRGIPDAVRSGNISDIGEAYNVKKEAEERLGAQYEQENPGMALAADVGGALSLPFATGEKVLLAGGSKLLNAASSAGRAAPLLTKAGNAATRAGKFIASSGPVRQAFIAGGVQGGLQAAGRSEDVADMPANAIYGAGVGALTGGVLGAAGNALAKVPQVVKDRLPANASRKAYERVEQLLGKGKLTPEQARAEIARTDALGGDAIVADLTPGLQAKAANLSRKPGLENSLPLNERGVNRMADRGLRFEQAVQERASLPKAASDDGFDAMARSERVNKARKAAGERDYAEGGAMDNPVEWSPSLDKFFREAPEQTNKAMRSAYDDMLLRRESPGDMFDGEGTFTHIPNLRSLDYLKRGFDREIGKAIKAGDNSTAQGLSGELNKIKDLIGEANPQYKEILATQRDAFQKMSALETGQKVIARLSREPRQILREFSKLDDANKQEWRIGVLDAILQTTNKADPTKYLSSLLRNSNTANGAARRKVLEAAFGGELRLSSLERWMAKEMRSGRTDAKVAGPQSITSEVGLADEAARDGGLGEAALAGLRVGAFNPFAGVVAAWRKLVDISHGENLKVQDEIARILNSKGEDLAEGVKSAKSFAERRAARDKRRAILLGKAGQAPFMGAANSTGGE